MSLAVLCRLLSHPRIKSAQTVLMYYSLPDEVNTHQAVDELVKEGKQVLLPVVKGQTSWNSVSIMTAATSVKVHSISWNPREPFSMTTAKLM
jgi:5-formyltetrahydrofolate cyclo-ligase